MSWRTWLTLVLTTGVVIAAAAWAAEDAGALAKCLNEETQRNFAAFHDYACTMTSHRKAWKKDGTLEKDNVVVKKFSVRAPRETSEEFVSGTINGEPAAKNDFVWERLGMDQVTTFYDIECFRPGNLAKFEFKPAPMAERDGAMRRVLTFRSLEPDKTELQEGRFFVPENSCRPIAMSGVFLHRLVVTNKVDFDATFVEVSPEVWLPSHMEVKGDVSLGPLYARRIWVRNEFTDYRLDVEAGK